MTNMRDGICNYGEGREGALMDYLYGETDDSSVDFARHLAQCAVCRVEVGALGRVRGDLAAWQAPELTGQIVFRPADEDRVVPVTPPSMWQRVAEIPVWAQTAAAILCLGVAAGFANVQVSHTSDGWSVQTGWRPTVVREAAPSTASAPASAVLASAPATQSEPWRAEFNALADQLRRELAARPQTVASTPSDNDDALMRKVRAAVLESEQRQKRELALGLAQIANDVQTQRQADLVKIERNLGLIQRNTGMEVMRTQQQLNNLVQRVSQQP